MISRRTVLGLIAMAGSTGLPMANALATESGSSNEPTAGPVKKPAVPVRLGEAEAFSRDTLVELARALSKADYVEPRKIPQPWIDMSYDEYKGIQFNPDSGLWNDTDLPYIMEFFAPGLYFPTAISISVVDGDTSRPVLFSKDVFRYGHLVPDLPVDETLGYAGFRVRTTINDPVRKDEFVVFQGASYFRAVGKGQIYGLSARGLAIDTGEAKGEEFPDFRAFWIEGVEPGAKSFTVHALMDSPSVSGLYSFEIMAGPSTEMDVKAVLFPRMSLTHVGIGAETSMFLFDETNRHRFDDFRPAVHDSDGLLIENGAGETLWRQLANPLSLQVSSFVDDNPRGFGLMQRPRAFADYADLEANYHKRPGLWVTPGEGWGKGSVTLVEIPADREIYDNIVAYWRPREPLAAGSSHQFSYRLHWCEDPPINQDLPKVLNTRMGKRFVGGRLVTVDFSNAPILPKKLEDITLHVSSNQGKVSEGILQRNPRTGGVRLAFTFYPEDLTSIELRAQLMVGDKRASEVWLYRWTA
ncbi:MAG: glucan biosynthesis protein G [Rhizobiaceae bacterium]